jgi:AcrR family transcriptional regulator
MGLATCTVYVYSVVLAVPKFNFDTKFMMYYYSILELKKSLANVYGYPWKSKRMNTQKRSERPSSPSPVNHRTIVGRQRRAKTESRILRSALQVFAQKGTHAVIDDFILAAGIARGTFYNYYRSTDQLLEAVRLMLTDEHNQSVEEALAGIDDPITRLGTGIRLWMWRAENDHHWAGFVARVRLHGTRSLEAPKNDLRRALRKKQIRIPNIDVALDVLEGAGTSSMHRMLEGPIIKDYANAFTTMMLQALGVDAETICRILALPLPRMKIMSRHEHSSATGQTSGNRPGNIPAF